MAKPGDRKKLNACIEILDQTDLGLSLVWLWVWNTIKNLMEDKEYKFLLTEEEVWDKLVEHIANGYGFSLEYGAEQIYEDITEWLLNNDIMKDMMFADEEDED